MALKTRHVIHYLEKQLSPPPPIFQTNQLFNPPISGH